MKNFIPLLLITAASMSCIGLVGCASQKAASNEAKPAAAANPEAGFVELKPIYAIAAPAQAALKTFAYFYDQDRGDSFFVTAPTSKTLFQIGTDEGELFQSISKTVKEPMSDHAWVREADGTLFMLDGKQVLQVVGVDVLPRSYGAQKLTDLVNPQAMAITKLSPGYRVVVLDKQPTGDKLKFFRADMKSKALADVGDLALLSVQATSELDLDATQISSLSAHPLEPGFMLTQSKTLRFLDKDGQFTEQKPVALKAETLAIDVMACARGSNPGYWIALQKTDAGFQLELLSRLSFESIGTVSLPGIKAASDMRFVGRMTKYLPNGGVFLIADDKLTAYNWQDIASALGARKMCF